MNQTMALFNGKLNREFIEEDACLEKLFQLQIEKLKNCPYCGLPAKYYRLKNRRKAFSCLYCRHQLHPLANTIFHKSTTPLTKWFFAIYLISSTEKAVSVKELERQLGVTYKCAWRIAKQIRTLTADDITALLG